MQAVFVLSLTDSFCPKQNMETYNSNTNQGMLAKKDSKYINGSIRCKAKQNRGIWDKGGKYTDVKDKLKALISVTNYCFARFCLN